jgi:hypothetical protein
LTWKVAILPQRGGLSSAGNSDGSRHLWQYV